MDGQAETTGKCAAMDSDFWPADEDYRSVPWNLIFYGCYGGPAFTINAEEYTRWFSNRNQV